MAKVKAASSQASSRNLRPALSPDNRESQLISLATDLAEQQLRDGTASSQVITHFLKLGTAKAELEKEKLRYENDLTKAKTEALQSAKRVEDLYANAIKAMRDYNGMGGAEDEV